MDSKYNRPMTGREDPSVVNTKTSIFRRIGTRRLESLRAAMHNEDTTILEMMVGLMSEQEFIELSGVMKHYAELSDKNQQQAPK